MLATKSVLTRSASSSAVARSRSAASMRLESVTSTIVKSALPSGSGTAANWKCRPSVIDIRPFADWRSLVVWRTISRICAAAVGLTSFRAIAGHQLVDARMLREPFLVELPIFEETPVPQVEPPVACEDADRFEQIVEGRGAHPQQGVARRREAQLLGPVLEEQAQPAVGKRLGDHADVIAAGKHPFFFDHLLGAGEPLPPLVPSRPESRALPGSRWLSRMRSSTRSNSGLLGKPFGIELGHHRERPVEEAQTSGRHRIARCPRSSGRPARAAIPCGGRARCGRPRDPGRRPRTPPPRRSTAAR